jgi:hypothetical protein
MDDIVGSAGRYEAALAQQGHHAIRQLGEIVEKLPNGITEVQQL